MNNGQEDSYFAPLREALPGLLPETLLEVLFEVLPAALTETLPETLARFADGTLLRVLPPRAGAAWWRAADFFLVVALLRDVFLPVALRVEVFAAAFAGSAGSAAAAGSTGLVFDLSRSARNAVEDSTDFRPCR